MKMEALKINVTNEVETAEAFVEAYNKHRLANKEKWCTFYGIVNGKIVAVKSFNTSIQILEVNGLKTSSRWDLKVGEFKIVILEAIQ